ncbi:MAG: anhydro-N-acetylmuramic acid kinase [Saprospiraceae bacterium]
MHQTAIDSQFAFSKPEVVIGLMSGTSMDGLDICAVELSVLPKGEWSFNILASQSLSYSSYWFDKLHSAFAKTRPELEQLHLEYGTFLGEEVKRFCTENPEVRPTLIASHGHTIHHRPDEGYTFQMGDGNALSKASGYPVMCDFRTLDVELGGQGAPLVPIVDRLLFRSYSQCLNLGGFANVSFEHASGRLAYDITLVNVLLNRLANQLGKEYDPEGSIAKGGVVQPTLLAPLEALSYYDQAPPKSLGREWLEQTVWPLFEGTTFSSEDLLATGTAHIANALARDLSRGPEGEILVTGGGGLNAFLIDSLRQNLPPTHTLVLPKGELIDQKEAIAFALLGALRMRGEVNTLASVTGARHDSCGGRLFDVR